MTVLLLLIALEARAATEAATYASLVEQYRSGDSDGAIAGLLAWKSDAMVVIARDSTVSSFPAALMLHTEAGLLLNFRGDARGASAQWLVAQTLAEAPALQKQPGFLRAWYRALGLYFLGSYLDPMAVALLERGRERFPDDLAIALALAQTYEMRATFSSTKMNPVWPDLSPRGKEELAKAAAIDRDVLARDPDRAEARLRLGRVLQIGASPEMAFAEFRRVETTARDQTLQYLASLFAGQQLRREGHLPEAREEFARALESCAQGQSAALGLAEIMHTLGERGDATSLLARALVDQSVVPRPDPFRKYYYGDHEEQMRLLLGVQALARGGP